MTLAALASADGSEESEALRQAAGATLATLSVYRSPFGRIPDAISARGGTPEPLPPSDSLDSTAWFLIAADAYAMTRPDRRDEMTEHLLPAVLEALTWLARRDRLEVGLLQALPYERTREARMDGTVSWWLAPNALASLALRAGAQVLERLGGAAEAIAWRDRGSDLAHLTRYLFDAATPVDYRWTPRRIQPLLMETRRWLDAQTARPFGNAWPTIGPSMASEAFDPWALAVASCAGCMVAPYDGAMYLRQASTRGVLGRLESVSSAQIHLAEAPWMLWSAELARANTQQAFDRFAEVVRPILSDDDGDEPSDPTRWGFPGSLLLSDLDPTDPTPSGATAGAWIWVSVVSRWLDRKLTPRTDLARWKAWWESLQSPPSRFETHLPPTASSSTRSLKALSLSTERPVRNPQDNG